jgi:hypothetical protein
VSKQVLDVITEGGGTVLAEGEDLNNKEMTSAIAWSEHDSFTGLNQ